jgi:ankyrin repeat protein
MTKWTVLHYAAHTGAATILKYILELNYRSANGFFADIDELAEEPPVSPLFLAAQKGCLHCAMLLVAYGADPTKRQGNTERTPHAVAKSLELLDVLHIGRSAAIQSIYGRPDLSLVEANGD